MIAKREIKKEKSLNLHKGNQFTQVKEPTVLKAVITLKPKPVVVEPVTEPVVHRRHRPYEVKNENVKLTQKEKPVRVNLIKVKHSNILRSEQFLTELKKKYPVIAQNYPLEIGVSKKLQSLHPEMANRIVNTAMYIHTHSELYVEFLSKGMGRFDLEGNFVSSIDGVGQQQATELLAEIRRNKKSIRRKF